MVERTMIAAPEHREVLLTGDHADNEEVSEKRKFRQHPASFLLIHNFCTVLLREIGVGQSKPPRGWPSHARAGPPPRCCLSVRRQCTMIGANPRRRNVRIENGRRRSADKTWERHTAGARDWLLGTLRKGGAGHSSE